MNRKKSCSSKPCFVIFSFLWGVLLLYFVKNVYSAALTNGYMTMSDSRPSIASVTYTFSWTGVSTGTTIKCIEAKFATSAEGDTVPTAMTTTSATKGSSFSMVTPASWTLNNTTNGTLKLTYATGETPSNGTVVFDGITNGSTADTSYFARFKTYSDESCTSLIDFGTVEFIYTSGQLVTATVGSQLTFTITGVGSSQSVNGATTTIATVTGTNTVPFGTLSHLTNSVAAQDLNINTNAANGYSIKVKYTGALGFDGNVIDDFTGTNAEPASFSEAGTEAFGYTTDDLARFSSNKWAKLTTSFEELAYSSSPKSDTVRFGYQIGISSGTPAGTYTTTVIFQATPTY
jgi:hypothetical protein